MKVLKVKEVERECKGSTWDKGCGSLLLVSPADIKRGKEYNDGIAYETKYFVCPVCGTKTKVKSFGPE